MQKNKMATKQTIQFKGFKNKIKLRAHINKHFPNSQVVSFGKRKVVKGVTKTTPSFTSYLVTLKKKNKR